MVSRHREVPGALDGWRLIQPYGGSLNSGGISSASGHQAVICSEAAPVGAGRVGRTEADSPRRYVVEQSAGPLRLAGTRHLPVPAHKRLFVGGVERTEADSHMR